MDSEIHMLCCENISNTIHVLKSQLLIKFKYKADNHFMRKLYFRINYNYTHQMKWGGIIHLCQLWHEHLARVTADEKAKGGWTEPK